MQNETTTTDSGATVSTNDRRLHLLALGPRLTPPSPAFSQIRSVTLIVR